MLGTAAIMEKLKVCQCPVFTALLILPLSTARFSANNQGLPFEKVVHKVTTLDAQPAGPAAGSILVMVTGQLVVDDGSNILPYTQMFHVSCARAIRDESMLMMQLAPEGGSFFVQNDVFRL